MSFLPPQCSELSNNVNSAIQIFFIACLSPPQHLVKIYNQHDLHKLSDRQSSELKSQPIPMIICSEQLN
jgi:hypothetical protein